MPTRPVVAARISRGVVPTSVGMIDIEREHLIAIRDVPRHLPPKGNGRRLHISAVYRWMSRGVRGVVLESVRIGGTAYTTREALQRFADRLNDTRGGPTPRSRTTLTRKRQLERAERRLAEELGEKP